MKQLALFTLVACQPIIAAANEPRATPQQTEGKESPVDKTARPASKEDAIRPSKQDGLNVLMIAIDDLRPELACYGAKKVVSPNFDRLAASGVRFDRAYCQQAVCGASRLSVMTGLYPIQSGEQSYHVRDWRQRHRELLTMNQHFRDHHFRTIGLGKIYHARGGADADESGWDQWVNIRETMYADPVNLKHKRSFSIHNPETHLGSFTESLDVADDQYADGKRTTRTIELLSELAKSKERFFLALGFIKPHLPFVAPKRHWELYNRSDFAVPTGAAIPPGYPEFAANQSAWELKFYFDYEGNSPNDFSEELNKRLLHGYAACTSYIDACLGRVLDALDEAGLADDTVVVLWGDHGFKLGDHGSWSKHTNFETDTRVPLLVRVPGRAGGVTTQAIVELVDLYPTLCDLAGIPTPPHCQGRSFRKLLDDPESEHRRSAYSVYPADENVSEKVASGLVDPGVQPPEKMAMGHSIRFGNYRYTEWRPQPNEAATAAVLTELNADPAETTNVIDRSEHAAVLLVAQRQLSERVKTAGAGPGNTASKPAATIALLDFEDETRLDGSNTSHKATVTLVEDTPSAGGKLAAKTVVDSEAKAGGYFGTGFRLATTDLSESGSINLWIKTDIEGSFNLQLHSGASGNSGVSTAGFSTLGFKGKWKKVSTPVRRFSKPPWSKSEADFSQINKIQVTAFGNGPYDGKYILLDSIGVSGAAESDDEIRQAAETRRKVRAAKLREPVIVKQGERVEMFDGQTLDGWFSIPRVYVPRNERFNTMPADRLFDEVMTHYAMSDRSTNRIPDRERVKDKGVWKVEDGVVIGAQTPGSTAGAYLMSEKTYGDFELTLEANPDFPIDTGIMVRAHKLGSVGYQVLVDNRPNGTIGGVYGNSVGDFFAYPFVFDADEEPLNRVANLRRGKPNAMQFRGGQLRTDYAASLEEFLKVWKPNDWNEIKIRCTGRLPLIETWVNGVPIAKLDTATLADAVPGYDADAIFNRIGRKGHIGLEVHDSPTRERWAPGAKCRWRNVRIRELQCDEPTASMKPREHISLTQIGDRHWLVGADGQPLFAHGITHVSTRGARFSYSQFSKQCKELGFNAYGYGAPEELRSDMPFIESWNHLVPISTYRGKNVKFVDIFDPVEQARLERGVRLNCERALKHPSNIIGYCWTDLGAWPLKNSTGTNWVEFIRSLSADAPGQMAYQDFLGSWKGGDDKARDQAFLKLIAREYFRVVGSANRRYDPGHLIFGDRFAFNTIDPDVVEEMLPWVDAIAIQPQFWAPFPKQKFDEVYKLTGKPILLCDFAIRFKDGDKDVRMWNRAEDSVAAGEQYADYIRAALDTNYIVGAFWCNPVDTAKGFGKPGVKQGFFGNGLTEREGLHEAVRKLNEYRESVTPIGSKQKDAEAAKQ